MIDSTQEHESPLELHVDQRRMLVFASLVLTGLWLLAWGVLSVYADF